MTLRICTFLLLVCAVLSGKDTDKKNSKIMLLGGLKTLARGSKKDKKDSDMEDSTALSKPAQSVMFKFMKSMRKRIDKLTKKGSKESDSTVEENEPLYRKPSEIGSSNPAPTDSSSKPTIAADAQSLEKMVSDLNNIDEDDDVDDPDDDDESNSASNDAVQELLATAQRLARERGYDFNVSLNPIDSEPTDDSPPAGSKESRKMIKKPKFLKKLSRSGRKKMIRLIQRIIDKIGSSSPPTEPLGPNGDTTRMLQRTLEKGITRHNKGSMDVSKKKKPVSSTTTALNPSPSKSKSQPVVPTPSSIASTRPPSIKPVPAVEPKTNVSSSTRPPKPLRSETSSWEKTPAAPTTSTSAAGPVPLPLNHTNVEPVATALVDDQRMGAVKKEPFTKIGESQHPDVQKTPPVAPQRSSEPDVLQRGSSASSSDVVESQPSEGLRPPIHSTDISTEPTQQIRGAFVAEDPSSTRGWREEPSSIDTMSEETASEEPSDADLEPVSRLSHERLSRIDEEAITSEELLYGKSISDDVVGESLEPSKDVSHIPTVSASHFSDESHEPALQRGRGLEYSSTECSSHEIAVAPTAPGPKYDSSALSVTRVTSINAERIWDRHVSTPVHWSLPHGGEVVRITSTETLSVRQSKAHETPHHTGPGSRTPYSTRAKQRVPRYVVVILALVLGIALISGSVYFVHTKIRHRRLRNLLRYQPDPGQRHHHHFNLLDQDRQSLQLLNEELLAPFRELELEPSSTSFHAENRPTPKGKNAFYCEGSLNA